MWRHKRPTKTRTGYNGSYQGHGCSEPRWAEGASVSAASWLLPSQESKNPRSKPPELRVKPIGMIETVTKRPIPQEWEAKVIETNRRIEWIQRMPPTTYFSPASIIPKEFCQDWRPFNASKNPSKNPFCHVMDKMKVTDRWEDALVVLIQQIENRIIPFFELIQQWITFHQVQIVAQTVIQQHHTFILASSSSSSSSFSYFSSSNNYYCCSSDSSSYSSAATTAYFSVIRRHFLLNIHQLIYRYYYQDAVSQTIFYS